MKLQNCDSNVSCETLQYNKQAKTQNCERNLSPMILKGNQMGILVKLKIISLALWQNSNNFVISLVIFLLPVILTDTAGDKLLT